MSFLQTYDVSTLTVIIKNLSGDLDLDYPYHSRPHSCTSNVFGSELMSSSTNNAAFAFVKVNEFASGSIKL